MMKKMLAFLLVLSLAVGALAVTAPADKADEVEAQTNGQGEATIIEQDADNGENANG